uniref:Putative gibberellin receptor GID1L1 n=1 Tax=Aegilops tauschii TaxID=37682 RepID=R7W4V0_AEGTA
MASRILLPALLLLVCSHCGVAAARKARGGEASSQVKFDFSPFLIEYKSGVWLSQYGDLSRLFLAGDSAGGNIAHNLALRAGEEGLDGGARLKGVALLDPYFQGRSAVGAYSADPSFLQSAARTWSFICAGKYPIDHPYANPLMLPTASWQHLGASRVLVTVSGQDRLSPWQRAYYSALRSSGWPGQAELYETPGEGHVYFLTKMSTPQAQAEMATLVAFINRDD